jgi:hypothetical protein
MLLFLFPQADATRPSVPKDRPRCRCAVHRGKARRLALAAGFD